MRNVLGVLTAVMILAACSGTPELLVDGASSREELARAIRRAVDSGDREALMALHYWEGVTEEDRELKRKFIERFFKGKIESVEFKPLMKFRNEFTRGGVPYRMNVELRGNIQLRFEKSIGGSIGFSISYGVAGERFYLPVAVQATETGRQESLVDE